MDRQSAVRSGYSECCVDLCVSVRKSRIECNVHRMQRLILINVSRSTAARIASRGLQNRSWNQVGGGLRIYLDLRQEVAKRPIWLG